MNLLAFPFVWIIWDGFTSPVLAAPLWIVHLLITYGVYAWFVWPALETTESGNNVKTKGNVKESALGTATIAATKGKIAASTAGRRRRWGNRPEQFYIGEQARTEEPARDTETDTIAITNANTESFWIGEVSDEDQVWSIDWCSLRTKPEGCDKPLPTILDLESIPSDAVKEMQGCNRFAADASVLVDMKDRDKKNQKLVQVPAQDLSEPLEKKHKAADEICNALDTVIETHEDTATNADVEPDGAHYAETMSPEFEGEPGTGVHQTKLMQPEGCDKPLPMILHGAEEMPGCKRSATDASVLGDMKDRDKKQRLGQVPAMDLSEPLEKKASHKEPLETGPLLGKFWRQKGKKAAARRRQL